MSYSSSSALMARGRPGLMPLRLQPPPCGPALRARLFISLARNCRSMVGEVETKAKTRGALGLGPQRTPRRRNSIMRASSRIRLAWRRSQLFKRALGQANQFAVAKGIDIGRMGPVLDQRHLANGLASADMADTSSGAPVRAGAEGGQRAGPDQIETRQPDRHAPNK